VRKVIRHVNFNLPHRIQVFEVVIRMLGGLLSAHIFATDPNYGFFLNWYHNELLNLAEDLAQRLVPAFKESPTGIPWPRVRICSI